MRRLLYLTVLRTQQSRLVSAHGVGALRTRKKDPGHIPKPLNAFMCFRKAFFKVEKQARLRNLRSGPLSGGAGGSQQKHVSIRAGEAWNALPAEERTPYTLEAAELRRLHELKYPRLHEEGNSAGAKATRTSKVAAQKRRRRKERKMRASDDLAAVLNGSLANSSLHTGYGVPMVHPHVIFPSQEFLPVPASIHLFNHENNWSTPSPHSDVLRLPTPALTPSHGPSPSPAPSDLYSFPPSGNGSRVASPAVLDLVPDDAFCWDLPQAPVAPFTAHGEDSSSHEYQAYYYQPSFNSCAPLAPHHLGHVACPPPVPDGAFPDPFATETTPIPNSMSLGTELEGSQAVYFWPEEPVDQAPLTSVFDVAVDQGVQQSATQCSGSLGMSEVRSLDWWLAYVSSIPPCDDPLFGSSDFHNRYVR